MEREQPKSPPQSSTEPGLLDSIPALIYRATADSNWKAHFLSPAVKTLTGHPPERFRGPDAIHFFQLVHPDDQAGARSVLDDALAGKTDYHNEFRIIRADGEIRHVHDHGHGTYDEQGNLLYVEGVVVDVSETYRLNRELAQQSANLRELARALGATEERVRHHVISVLHEDLQQVLVACSLQLSTMKTSTAVEATHVAAAQELLDNSLRVSRQLVRTLQPPSLEQGQMAPAFDVLTDWFRDHYGMQVEVAVATTRQLPASLADVCFQAARELLFNVFKHAETEQAELDLETNDQTVCLTVTDRGKGFDPGPRLPSESFGLATLQARIEAMSGTMTVTSAPGAGTQVQIVIPLAIP